jgi:4-hydroxybenzoate polyprenyltransferase
MLSIATNVHRPGFLRTLLVLGRISNLPTVWSNCLAGWILGGSGSALRFILLCAGASLLYIGGMYLNDAFDAQFDQQHRRERPIPSGAISERTVWQLGFTWLALGLLLLSSLGFATAFLALLLALTILLYDAIHKIFAFSPVLMAVCRFYVYLAAASVGYDGITGLSIWSGLVLACYVVGLSYLARRESTGVTLQYWPCLFLATPIVLAAIINTGEYRLRACFLSGLLLVWVVYCLRFTFWSHQRNIGRSVSGLLAGIVLLDWLAVGPGVMSLSPVFVALFIVALLLQRVVPAT